MPAMTPKALDPMAGIDLPAAYPGLSVGVVPSENLKRQFEHGVKMNRFARYDMHAMRDRAQAVFKRNFQRVIQLGSLREAAASGVDAIAVLDILAEGRGRNWKFSAGSLLFAPDGRKLEEVRGEKAVEFQAFNTGSVIEAAFYGAIDQMEAALRNSSALGGLAASKGGRPASAPEPRARVYRSDADAPKYRLPEDPQAYALVVGVEKYAKLPPAEFAERDARSVRAHLHALGVPERNIVLLTGVEASRAGLSKHLEVWLANNVGPDSTVYFYYSGHGAPDVKTRQAYLVPIDGDPKYLEVTGYPLTRLYETLGGLPAKRVLVALDSCFSGAGGRSIVPRGTRPLITKLERAPVRGNVTVLSASGADEITGTAAEQGHGLFTYHLLKGLNGDGRDTHGRLTVTSLFDYLKDQVADAAKRADNRDQHPTLAGAETPWVLRALKP
jgi:hypothetical protein